ncbi:MAG: ABC transporter ATP-binding protein [Pseudomonadota bacterium]
MTDTIEYAIEISGLRTQFDDFIVHNNLDLRVRSGEILGVVGGSGTGKSVLLRTIIGLNKHTQGSIKVFGQDTHQQSAETLKTLRENWGVLFQDGALFTSLTVAQNVQVPLREYYAMPQHLMDEIAAYKISMAGLPPDAGPKFPSDLSGGMRKRAGLARALALDPKILFLDEPTAGLDPIGAAAFDALIVRLKETLGLTVFLVTHDLDTLHATCDRVAVLADKRVLTIGTMEEMMAFDHPWVTEYFHGVRARAALPNAHEAPMSPVV